MSGTKAIRLLKRRSSLAQRIIMAFVLMTSLVAGVFALGTVLTVHFLEERLLSQDLTQDMQHLLRQLRETGMVSLEGRPDQLFFYFRETDTQSIPADIRDLDPGFHEVFRNELSYHAMILAESGWRYILLQDQTDFERRERAIYTAIKIGFVLCVLLSLLLGWLLARRVMSPLTRLAHQVRRRDRSLLKSIPPLAPFYPRDEVGLLASALDEAFALLHQALERERLFTSDVSHELRTPLMVLASSCELLRENPDLPPSALRQVDRIERAVTHMRDLVETFLHLARLESGKGRLAPRASLQSVAEELVEYWGEPIRARGLALHFQPGPLSEELYHAPFLRSVMSNLLRNALHYCPQGAIWVTLSGDSFTVEDSGDGIPEALQGAIFDPYVRGESSRADGLGLGLSLVKRICQHEGWTITLRPHQPHGCCFEVRLRPAAVEQAE